MNVSNKNKSFANAKLKKQSQEHAVETSQYGFDLLSSSAPAASSS
jgi:hypothetical protein